MVYETMAERVYSLTGEGTKENSLGGVQEKSLNIERLRTFSRSLENLTSETLYSKWKRSRGEGNRSNRRPRSISLITPPSFTCEEKEQHIKPTRKNSFHVLQENVFRPRCWTIGSPMEVIREHNAMQALDINNNNTSSHSDSAVNRRTRKTGKQYRVTLQIPRKQHSPPLATSKEELEAEIKPMFQEQRGQVDRKQVVETTSEVFIKPSQKLRRVSEAAQEDEDPPIIARLISEEGGPATRVDSVPKKPVVRNLFIETARIEFPQQSASMPASPNFLVRKDSEKEWDAVDGTNNEQSAGLSNAVVKNASEMAADNERSKPLQNTFSLGCTYAVVSQPSRANENSVQPIAAKMNSTVITKEQRAELEEEFRKLKKVSLELDKDEFEDGLRKRKSYPEVNTKDILESQPFRRFSELNNVRVSSSRPTARAILENITNVANKTEKQRIHNIEKAFEWIRKELAELRAQDKDIMRTFSKIQAGIRKIKLQRALSGALDEPYEYDIVDHSMDLSASFSYVPLVREFHSTFPRRASLI